MIYVSDDYLEKYIEVFGYIFSRSFSEGYRSEYIEATLAKSQMINELENSNITTIAFSSCEKIYADLFPQYENNNQDYSPYSIYGWMGYIYVNIFLKFQVTFETIFIVLPLEKALSLYNLYHEMDITSVYQLFKESVKYSYLDNIMNSRNVSSKNLAELSNVPFSTINSLRYGKRDINKLEGIKAYLLSSSLNIKMSSLLTNLNLKIEE